MAVAVVALLSTVLRAQIAPEYPFRAADEQASRRIAALRAQVAAGSRTALTDFWAELATRGAPLIEPLATSPRHSLVTFVWRGTAATRRVVIADGVAAGAGGVDPANSQMIRLADTDLWYRSYEVRNDARFTYKLSENDSMQSFVDPNRVSRSVVDPLNPRVYPTGHSYLELGGAPAQIGGSPAFSRSTLYPGHGERWARASIPAVRSWPGRAWADWRRRAPPSLIRVSLAVRCRSRGLSGGSRRARPNPNG